MSTGWSKFRGRGPKSRQKTEELLLFCLPDTSKSTRAASKVDKNRGMSLFCLPSGPNSGREDLKVEQNLQKLKKYSTRLPSPKHFGLRLRANSKKQRFARDRGQVQRLSCCRTELPLAKSLPFTDKSMKMDTLSVNPHHNGQKFTDKSLKNGGLSVKCVLLTDKSEKTKALSVNLNEVLARCPK